MLQLQGNRNNLQVSLKSVESILKFLQLLIMLIYPIFFAYYFDCHFLIIFNYPIYLPTLFANRKLSISMFQFENQQILLFCFKASNTFINQHHYY